jgi:hypothetical protein
MASLKRFLKVAGICSFGVVIGILGPWFDGLFSLGLVPASFQPGAKGAASALAALCFLLAYAVTSKAPRYKISRWAIGSGVCTVVSLVLCLSVRAYALTAAPSILGTHVIWILWLSLYGLIFVSFSASLSLTLRII